MINLYAIATNEQFVNNRDDRARGEGNNPFGNYSGTGTATTNEQAVGPLPGDEGLYTFDLYTSANLKQSAGTAVFVCQYNFGKNGSCDVSYKLKGGTLIGVGAFSAFATKTFGLTITGGTGEYRSMKGTVEASRDTKAGSLVGKRARVSHTAPVLMLEPQHLAFAIQPAVGVAPRSAGGSTHLKGITLYSVTSKEQYIDNGDDEARGWLSNPFGMRDKVSETAESEDKSGPFPGDEAIFGFKLYSDSSLKDSAGSAVYTCEYYFTKNSFCVATYQLNGGTVFGAAAFSFNAMTFGFAITGGAGEYANATGEISAKPAAKHSQHLSFNMS